MADKYLVNAFLLTPSGLQNLLSYVCAFT